MDDITAALVLLQCLDLTSLNEDDNEEKIKKLCQKAQTPYGNVASVCVYPQFVPLAKECLQNTGIKVATVINFPLADKTLENTLMEASDALLKGADEIDAVFPYKEFINQNTEDSAKFIHTLKNHIGKKIPLKIIIESGELKKTSLIVQATRLCIENGADFVKTSTGKTPVSATPEAANAILDTIAAGRRNVGFKASGGIRTIDDAKKYLILAEAVMGGKWVTPKNFRIGASSLLDNLIETIERGY